MSVLLRFTGVFLVFSVNVPDFNAKPERYPHCLRHLCSSWQLDPVYETRVGPNKMCVLHLSLMELFFEYLV